MRRPYLLFALGDDTLAVPVERVEGILPPARVTPMPFVPAWVEGLVSARGAVLPQVDLSIRRHGRPYAGDRQELLQLTSTQGRFVLKVERVLRLVEAEADDGRITLGDQAVDVVDPDEVALADEAGAAALPPLGDFFTTTEAPPPTEPVLEAERTVVFESGGERFALPIRRVREVVRLERIEPVPLAPRPLLGLMPLRDELVPVVAASEALGVANGPATKVVVALAGERMIGLAVEKVLGIRRAGDLEDLPLVDSITGVVACWVGEDGRPVGLLHMETLLHEEAMDRLAAALPQGGRTKAAEIAPEDARALLTFQVGSQMCAVDALAVERVVEWQAPHAVPDGSGGVDGVIHLGGEVLPVLDLGRRLGIDGPAHAYLVADLAGAKTALVIGPPGRIATVPVSAVRAMGPGNDGQPLSAVARVDGALAWVLSPPALAEVRP